MDVVITKFQHMIKDMPSEQIQLGHPYPDFHDVLEIALAMYEDDNKKDDSLIEVLRDLATFELFWRHGSDSPPLDRLSKPSRKYLPQLLLKFW